MEEEISSKKNARLKHNREATAWDNDHLSISLWFDILLWLDKEEVAILRNLLNEEDAIPA